MNAQEILAQIEVRFEAAPAQSMEKHAWLHLRRLLDTLTDGEREGHRLTLLSIRNTQEKRQARDGEDAKRTAIIKAIDTVLGWFEENMDHPAVGLQSADAQEVQL